MKKGKKLNRIQYRIKNKKKVLLKKTKKVKINPFQFNFFTFRRIS